MRALVCVFRDEIYIDIYFFVEITKKYMFSFLGGEKKRAVWRVIQIS